VQQVQQGRAVFYFVQTRSGLQKTMPLKL